MTQELSDTEEVYETNTDLSRYQNTDFNPEMSRRGFFRQAWKAVKVAGATAVGSSLSYSLGGCGSGGLAGKKDGRTVPNNVDGRPGNYKYDFTDYEQTILGYIEAEINQEPELMKAASSNLKNLSRAMLELTDSIMSGDSTDQVRDDFNFMFTHGFFDLEDVMPEVALGKINNKEEREILEDIVDRYSLQYNQSFRKMRQGYPFVLESYEIHSESSEWCNTKETELKNMFKRWSKATMGLVPSNLQGYKCIDIDIYGRFPDEYELEVEGPTWLVMTLAKSNDEWRVFGVDRPEEIAYFMKE